MGLRLVIQEDVTYVFDTGPLLIARERGLDITGTLGLLCTAIRPGQLTVPMVEQLADDLLSGTYFLPFGSGGFRRWAEDQGLLGPAGPVS